jgi:Flp pilus assembly protein TadB
MSSVDVFSICAFVGVLLIGTMLMTVQDLKGKRPEGRIKTRMQTSFQVVASANSGKQVEHELMFQLDKPKNRYRQWVDPKLTRLTTVSGKSGLRIVIAFTVVAEMVALAMVQFMPLPVWSQPMIIVLFPVFATMRTYKYLVERFRKKFLDGFPDVIDLIVRAVRAGVPVTQVMTTAAEECNEPLKSEFRAMGDSIKVGRELEEALTVAMHRIQIADFSFFCVCLLLQKETGGQLGETLDNLSGIVRSRREVRQKTKALTGEARITTKILAAVPVVILGSMYAINPETMSDFFHSTAGHKVFTYVVISIVSGVLLINKISKLDTSR